MIVYFHHSAKSIQFFILQDFCLSQIWFSHDWLTFETHTLIYNKNIEWLQLILMRHQKCPIRSKAFKRDEFLTNHSEDFNALTSFLLSKTQTLGPLKQWRVVAAVWSYCPILLTLIEEPLLIDHLLFFSTPVLAPGPSIQPLGNSCTTTDTHYPHIWAHPFLIWDLRTSAGISIAP